ncbi:hypothetical protein ABW19_dt0204615 [Dactylella cylindrospora]|nr:hypothetical protein ABW19_dt0204615 [Dactylella cylindrospora]
MLGCYGFRWLRAKWEKELEDEHLNKYRIPEYGKGLEEEGRDTKANHQDGVQGERSSTAWMDQGNAPGSQGWFAQNNPYTAARRTYSGTFATARKPRIRKPSNLSIEQYNFHNESNLGGEEGAGGDSHADEWKSSGGEPPVGHSDSQNQDGPVQRSADSYPFGKGEEATSSTTWSNSATSAGEFAQKRRKAKNKDKEKEPTSPQRDSQNRLEGFECTSPTCQKLRQGIDGSTSSSSQSCPHCSGSSTSWTEREKQLRRALKKARAAQSSSRGDKASAVQGDENDGVSSDQETGSSIAKQESSGIQSPDRAYLRPGSGSSRREHETPSGSDQTTSGPQRQQTRAMKEIVASGTYHDQQAAMAHMNNVIWSEVGEHFERQVRIQAEPPIRDRGTNARTSHWWSFRKSKKIQEEVEMADLKKMKKLKPEGQPGRVRRRPLLVAIIVACCIMTTLPPFLSIGGDILAHDYQFNYACNGYRWDIKLDASGLHPEQNNIFNRAVFKDRRGRGYEKEFMMNLEGMSTYGEGLDVTLVDQRRGYVFYLSPKDLANQPDGGESIKFPYPVVVAYDMLKHAYYAHDTVWRDLNDESFFDAGAFMNGTLGIFPNEGIWLDKWEKDGYCGQPKRALKNGYDQRILWTVVDDRKDCTLLRVCGSNQATRRQVVIATGMILLRLAMSATCCSKQSDQSGEVVV